jgi:hypothetical protein
MCPVVSGQRRQQPTVRAKCVPRFYAVPRPCGAGEEKRRGDGVSERGSSGVDASSSEVRPYRPSGRTGLTDGASLLDTLGGRPGSRANQGARSHLSEPTTDPYTGAGLMEFLDAAIDKGWFNLNSAKALKSACQKIFEVEQGWENLDLRSLDIEALLDRWQNLRRNGYNDGSMRTYRTRFSQAVKMHLARLGDDPDWKNYGPATRSVAAGAAPRPNGTVKRGIAAATASSATDSPGPPAPHPTTRPALMDFPYPLRDDLDVFLRLPRDLGAAEAERLCKYIRSLARDDLPISTARASAETTSGV